MCQTRIEQTEPTNVAKGDHWRLGRGVLPLTILIVAAVGMRVTLQHHKQEVASIRGECESLVAAAETARDGVQRLADERREEIARLGPRLSASERDNGLLLSEVQQTKARLTEALASNGHLEQELANLRVRFEESETASKVQLARAEASAAKLRQELGNAETLFQEYRTLAQTELTEARALNGCLQDELTATQLQLAETEANSQEEVAAARYEQNRLSEALRAADKRLEDLVQADATTAPPPEELGPTEIPPEHSREALWPVGDEHLPLELLMMPATPPAEDTRSVVEESVPGPDTLRVQGIARLRNGIVAQTQKAERVIGKALQWLREIKEASVLRDDRGLLGKQADASGG